MKLTDKSKLLGQILRHDPFSFGLEISREGWVSVSEVIDKVEALNSFDLIDTIVNNHSNKKRYAFNEDKTLVRALQGHSIKDIEIAFEKVTPSHNLFHGTHPDLVNVIMKEGLKPMTRLFVHLSKDKETAYKVGKRYSKKLEPVILIVDKNADIDFYISENEVYLTKYVDPKYISILE